MSGTIPLILDIKGNSLDDGPGIRSVVFFKGYPLSCLLCHNCRDCTNACPSGALEHVGRRMEINDIVSRVVRDKPFFETSGGGVTLSGGEPALFPEFLSQLLQAFKGQGIHTLIETCCQFSFEAFREKIYPHLDTIYFDIKLMESVRQVNAWTDSATLEACKKRFHASGIAAI